jgi:hypothetical protein
MIEFVRVELPTQCVAVDAQNLRRARLVALRTVQHSFNESLFKLAHRLIEQDSPFHHLAYKSFELILHGTLQEIAQSRFVANRVPDR